MMQDDSPLFDSFSDLLLFARRQSPCKADPKLCAPRKIDMVIWDADDTLWDMSPPNIASVCQPPFERLSDDTVTASCGILTSKKGVVKSRPMLTRISLKPTMLGTLDALEKIGVKSAICSSNNEGSVEDVLEAMGIKDRFVHIACSWEPKAKMVEKILADTGIEGASTIFVDDNQANVERVHMRHHSLPLVMDDDITLPFEVLGYIKD